MLRVLKPDLDEDRDRGLITSPLHEAFKRVFGAVSCGDENGPVNERQIVFVLPGSRKMWLRHMLSHLSVPDKTTPFYVLCISATDTRDDTYAGMTHYLVESGHAEEIDLSDASDLLSTICATIVTDRTVKEPLYPILDRAFPGGIEAIVEISLRPAGADHNLIAYPPAERQRPAAISLAFGACLVGDLSEAAFVKLCTNPPFIDSDRLIAIAQAAFDIRSNLQIDPNRLASLSEYLRDRNITVVEDKLDKDRWAELLPELFGNSLQGPSKLTPKCLNYQLGGIKWSHFDTLVALMDEPKHLESCDLLFLDLASSDGAHPDGVVSPMLRSHFVKLAAKLAQIRKARDPEAGPIRFASDMTSVSPSAHLPRARSALPIVIGFTATQSGVTTRTLLQDIAIDDFFFKSAGGPVHQRLHYYTLRQAIIGALERRAAWISYSEPARFREWILQFSPNERPTMLRMMDNYRHYSSNSMIGICSDALLNRAAPLLKNKGEKYILSYLGRPGKSGAMSLTLLAKAIDISSRSGEYMKPEIMTYDDYVAGSSSECARSVIFIDDFIGTGGQVMTNLEKLLSRSSRASVDHIWVWFMVGLNTPELKKLITGNDAQPFAAGEWHEIDIHGVSIFIRIEEIAERLVVSADEELILRQHCLITTGRDWEVPCQFEPFGWKKNRGLVSMFSNVPGNTLPIIWANGHINSWLPLKERFFNPFASRSSEWEDLPDCLQKTPCPLDPNLPASTRLDGSASEAQCTVLGCNIKLKQIHGAD